jgi:hypothetical protein
MKTLTEQIKQALNGLASAELGDRIGRRESADAQSLATSVAGHASTALSHKWIALGIGDSLPSHVMAYVIAACRRMQADLLLISDDAVRVRTLLAGYLPELNGIECQIEELANTSTANILSALNLHSGLLFAVSGAENDPLRPLLRARRGLRAPVPVVLVSPKSSHTPVVSRPKAARP